MERAQRLLMIGSDYQAVEATRERGLDITIVYGGGTKDWGMPLPAGVRTLFVDDQKNPEAVLTGLYRAGFGEGSFDAVYAHDDMALMSAAMLGQALGARAIPPRTVALFRDKDLQKGQLRRAGLPVTACHVIEDIRDLPADYELPYARAVVKPVAGMATQATSVVEDTAGVRRVGQECRERALPARTFVVEEYVDGDELFADGVVADGQVRFVSVSRYAQNCLDAVRSHVPVRITSLDPTADKWAYDAAQPLVVSALSTLGLTDGVFHLEFFHRPATGEVVFSECAARRGGGPIADQIRYKFGVDLAAHCLRAALGDVGEITPTVRDGVVASTFLPLVAGTVTAYPTAAEILAHPDVVHTRLYLPLGARLQGAASNTFGRIGEIIVHTDTEEHATRRLDEVSAWFAGQMTVLPLSPTFHELWTGPLNTAFADHAGVA